MRRQRQSHPKSTSAILADSLEDLKPYMDRDCPFCGPVWERAKRGREIYFETLKELTDTQSDLLVLRELIETGIPPDAYKSKVQTKDFHCSQEQSQMLAIKRLGIQLQRELKTLALYNQQARKYVCCDCSPMSFNKEMSKNPRWKHFR